MNKTVLLILTGMLAFLATGCSTSSDVADSKKELEENAAKPTPVQIDTPTTQTNETEAGEFADLDADKKTEPVQKIAALIPPTNPEVRVRTSVRGRQDPFALVSLTPKIKVEPKEVAKQPTSTPTRPTEEPNYRPREDVPTPSLSPSKPNLLAENVIISGLYEANGKTQLIIQEPNKSTSCYVEKGKYLAGDKILVKDVVNTNNSSPLVILEESGHEKRKIIGEVLEGSDDSNDSLPQFCPPNDIRLSNASLNWQ